MMLSGILVSILVMNSPLACERKTITLGLLPCLGVAKTISHGKKLLAKPCLRWCMVGDLDMTVITQTSELLTELTLRIPARSRSHARAPLKG